MHTFIRGGVLPLDAEDGHRRANLGPSRAKSSN